jgi:Leucine-rich repeat (LRR) protein
VIAKFSLALKLECDFVFHDWCKFDNRYACRVKYLEVNESNMRFLAMEGTHLFNKSNSDVYGIVFDRQNMSYLVQGATAFFSKLEDFHVLHSNLSHIQRNDFRHMKNLKQISISYNNIERIPEDTFVDVLKLETLMLSHNKIKSLPSNVFRTLDNLQAIYLNNNELTEISHLLFKFNTKLIEIHLQQNDLKFVSKNITESLRNLNQISLHGNVCINKDYNEITPNKIETLIDEIYENCTSECELEMTKVAECNDKYYELEKENDQLRKENSKLRNFMRSNLIV